MSCKCAIKTDEYYGWECSVSGGACMYLIPNSKQCAKDYGEWPDANVTDLGRAMRYKCIVEFTVPFLDDNECMTDNYMVVEVGSIWEKNESERSVSDVYLEKDSEWISISENTLKEAFVLIKRGEE